MPPINKKPAFRKLKGYAFDPSLSLKTDTAFINNITYKTKWEEGLKEGPIGEYIEVVDYDPTTKRFYYPVDLNDPYLLAQDGLEPSETNPQFHQQMVYAVIMTTIKNFETALGRKIIWSPRRVADPKIYEQYVGKLRIYPHAMRDANAYYSPQKKALLFGYFESTPASSTLHMPNSFVFTCLSHDIIAHEVTHAILDGIYPNYSSASNADVLAFHEAFADIVALFQHFTFPEVLRHQIAKTKGDLSSQNMLGQLAQEFGSAIGSYGSLRDALGKIDPKTKQWIPLEPTGNEYAEVTEPHERGSILVSAIFEAFLTIYKNRIKDLLRLATGGSGILPQGELHPDLVNRLADEASKAAGHVLSMCIRALDYCPPVDITFGDYLRAIITADADLVANDSKDYRLAFMEAFRRRGIYPKDIKTFSPESLSFKIDDDISDGTKELFTVIGEFLRDYREDISYKTNREEIYNISKAYLGGSYKGEKKIVGLHSRISWKFNDSMDFERLTGLVFSPDWQSLGIKAGKTSGPSFQISNLRLVSRVGPDGNQLNQIVFSLLQHGGVIMDGDEFKGYYTPDSSDVPAGGFNFYGGCTMIFDLNSLKLKYVIPKPLLDLPALETGNRRLDLDRAQQQYMFQQEEGLMHLSEYNQYFGNGLNNNFNEPFAFLHQ